jgi:hypothetical protein
MKGTEMSDNVEELKKQLAEQEARAEKFQRLYTEETVDRELRKAAEAWPFTEEAVRGRGKVAS